MSSTPSVLRRAGTAGLAAVALLAGAPSLGTALAQTAPAPTAVALSADDSAAAGTCAAFVVTVTGSGGARVPNAVVDVVLTERAASAGQDLDFCTAATGTRTPQAVAKGTDSGAGGTSDRGEVTTGADGTAVVGVVASERGTAEVAAFVDTNGNDVREAVEVQDVALLFVTAGGPAGTPAAANAVQCVDAQPETDTNVVGEQQSVIAVLTNNVNTNTTTGAQAPGGLVRDSGTAPCAGDTIAGVAASGVVTGANAGAAVTCTVSSNTGRSVCTYLAARTGTDSVRVFVNQTEGAGGPAADANEPSDVVARTAAARPTGLQVDLTCARADVGTSPEDCAVDVPAGRTDATVDLVATVVRRAANGTATPVEGVVVRFTEEGADATVVASPTGRAGTGGVGTADAQECVTAANGTCTAVLTERSPVGGETYGVTATVRGQDPAGDVAEGTTSGEISSDRGTVRFRIDARDARYVDLRPEGETSTPSGSFREFSAVVTDVNGTPVPGVSIAFTETGAGAFRNGSSSVTVVTDATGVARVDVTSGPTEAGLQQVTATIATAGTQCSAAAGQGATDTTPNPAAGTCADTEDNRFATGPVACSTPGSTSVSPAVITAGAAADVVVASTPGRLVRLYAYSRPSTVFQVVRSATATASTTTFRVFPATNTRLYGQEDGCAQSASVVLTVRSAVGISARRDASRVYTFSGSTNPRRPGQVVSLFRRGSGGDVLTAQVKTDSAGRYTITRRFTGSGLFDFYTRTSTDVVNASGASLVRRTLVY